MSVVKIAFLDVGQGDTTVISCPETHEAIVVDCVDSLAVLDYFEQEHINHLRGVIITHLHADHYGEVADLLNNCSDIVGTQGCEILATTEDIVNPRILSDPRKKGSRNKWKPDGDKHSTVYEQPSIGTKPLSPSVLAKLYQWCEENENRCEPLRATSRTTLPMDGTLAKSVKLLHPPHIYYQDLRSQGLNNISVVLRVTGNGSSALLMGDLEPVGWQRLKVRHPEIGSDILKFPHHGGAWSKNDTYDLLTVVRPSVVVISVGSNNIYDHPKGEVFDSLRKQRNIRLCCTQATEKCQLNVVNERIQVVKKFTTQSEKNNLFFVLPRNNQCPCAGTVIIELDDKPRIIQPATDFHEDIIYAHFKQHQCNVRSTTRPASTIAEVASFIYEA